MLWELVQHACYCCIDAVKHIYHPAPQVVCEVDGQETHNYRTQFISNPDVLAAAQATLAARRQQYVVQVGPNGKNTSWFIPISKPLTMSAQSKESLAEANKSLPVLVLMLDSLSRAQMNRKYGLPATTAFLRRLYRAIAAPVGPDGDASKVKDHNGTKGRRPGHGAFVFNRVNSQGMHSAGNLSPLYAGEYFERKYDLQRTQYGWYTKRVRKWIWELAKDEGYIVMAGGDTGNGLMGTATPCRECQHR